MQQPTPTPPVLDPWPMAAAAARPRPRPNRFERLIAAFSWSPLGDALTWTAAERSRRTRSQVTAVLLMAALVCTLGVTIFVLATHDFASVADATGLAILLFLALLANRRGGAWSSAAGVVLPLAVLVAVFISLETPTASGRLALSWVDMATFTFCVTAATFAPAVLSRRLALPILALALALPLYFLITETYAPDMLQLALRDGTIAPGTSLEAVRVQLIIFNANRLLFPTLAGALTTFALSWFVARDNRAYDDEVERANSAQRETKAMIEQDIGFARLLRQLHQALLDDKPLTMSTFAQRNPAFRGSATQFAYTELTNLLMAVGIKERRRQAAARDLFAGQQALSSLQALYTAAENRRAQVFAAATLRTLPPLLPQGAEPTDPMAVLLVTDLAAVQERFLQQLGAHAELYLRWLTTKPDSGHGYAQMPPQLFYGPLYLLALNTARVYGLPHPPREHIWDPANSYVSDPSDAFGGSQPGAGSPGLYGAQVTTRPGAGATAPTSTPARGPADPYPNLFEPFGER